MAAPPGRERSRVRSFGGLGGGFEGDFVAEGFEWLTRPARGWCRGTSSLLLRATGVDGLPADRVPLQNSQRVL
jgi:hypothetical protein